jgi:RNA polymerase sigma-70 factor, ECF subfamily
VREAYLNLVGDATVARHGHACFFTVAARWVRRLLLEPARAAPENAEVTAGSDDIDLLALDEALDRLADFDPAQARIVELRYFGGLTIDEAADTLRASPATVARDWTLARAWLRRELAPQG